MASPTAPAAPAAPADTPPATTPDGFDVEVHNTSGVRICTVRLLAGDAVMVPNLLADGTVIADGGRSSFRMTAGRHRVQIAACGGPPAEMDLVIDVSGPGLRIDADALTAWAAYPFGLVASVEVGGFVVSPGKGNTAGLIAPSFTFMANLAFTDFGLAFELLGRGGYLTTFPAGTEPVASAYGMLLAGFGGGGDRTQHNLCDFIGIGGMLLEGGLALFTVDVRLLLHHSGQLGFVLEGFVASQGDDPLVGLQFGLSQPVAW